MTGKPLRIWALELKENKAWLLICDEIKKTIGEFRDQMEAEEYGSPSHRELAMKAKHWNEMLEFIVTQIENTVKEKKHV